MKTTPFAERRMDTIKDGATCEAGKKARTAAPRLQISSGRLFQIARTQNFRDLHRIERRPLAQIVGHDPDIEAVLDSGIDPDAADIGRVVTHTFNRRDIAAILALVHDKAARRLAE